VNKKTAILLTFETHSRLKTG